jgi:hypothetical protein
VADEVEGRVFVKQLFQLLRSSLNFGTHLPAGFRDDSEQLLLLCRCPVSVDLDKSSPPLDRETRQPNSIIWRSALHLWGGVACIKDSFTIF